MQLSKGTDEIRSPQTWQNGDEHKGKMQPKMTQVKKKAWNEFLTSLYCWRAWNCTPAWTTRCPLNIAFTSNCVLNHDRNPRTVLSQWHLPMLMQTSKWHWQVLYYKQVFTWSKCTGWNSTGTVPTKLIYSQPGHTPKGFSTRHKTLSFLYSSPPQMPQGYVVSKTIKDTTWMLHIGYFVPSPVKEYTGYRALVMLPLPWRIPAHPTQATGCLCMFQAALCVHNS